MGLCMIFEGGRMFRNPNDETSVQGGKLLVFQRHFDLSCQEISGRRRKAFVSRFAHGQGGGHLGTSV